MPCLVGKIFLLLCVRLFIYGNYSFRTIGQKDYQELILCLSRKKNNLILFTDRNNRSFLKLQFE